MGNAAERVKDMSKSQSVLAHVWGPGAAAVSGRFSTTLAMSGTDQQAEQPKDRRNSGTYVPNSWRGVPHPTNVPTVGVALGHPQLPTLRGPCGPEKKLRFQVAKRQNP